MPSSWVVAFIGPVLGAHYLWGEDLNASFHLNMIRYVLGLHVNWSINSFAHIWGMRPFDRHNSSRDSRLFGFLAFGEGWHNFHHVSAIKLSSADHFNFDYYYRHFHGITKPASSAIIGSIFQ